ncbi:MAG: YicC family protein [Muribaculaceae bacterium]|uniref:YicC/YloC family endoribonuclease n=1 Tax=Sodaliphilus pleomorphus TaxID=2606626 RepID=UPI002409B07B|nr:YicC/YloC family endoribonuclease [Sodaliphilus pleomorphus]MCI5980198.1 YicC family protein [Muribaculaceae bacterium]MDD6687147.1 YicC family protein [Sodaliphilus pleomorphus]
MILSMTGFGKAVKVFNNKKITAEVKSLNSKQLDLSIRLPQAYREIELDLRNIIAKSLHRGKVDLFVYCEPIDGAVAASLNIDALKQYKVQLQAMSQQLDIPEPDDWYGTLLRLPDALKSDLNTSEVDDDEKNVVVEVVKNAIGGLNAFRLQEGKRLCGFFEEKIDAIQHLLDSVLPYEQSRVEKIKARILDSLQKLDGVEYDKNRFEQELIFYIEKLDITEEKLRLQNHLTYFLDTLHNGEAQGKKLGFISQEMGREINTMGSKANQAELQKLVVGMKDQLEQIKEQVLNVL